MKRFFTNICKMSNKKTLLDFGYAFNSEGELRRITENGQITDEPFEFQISKSQDVCQKHYDQLEKHGLERLPVPIGSKEDNGTFIFASKDFRERDTLMVLIHGSGAVRAGQWARSLIINENISKGTQIPYIKEAQNRQYGVLIMNTNDNYRNGVRINGSEKAELHAQYVWKNYIQDTKADKIVIVGHSYGGVVTFSLAETFKEDFFKRVKAIAFTDSVHGYSKCDVSSEMKQICRNWQTSVSPLDTPMKTPDNDVDRYSAGHTQHEMTSYSCMHSVFRFIEDKLTSSSK